MASSINASTTSGIVQTADTSGILNLQSNGTTKVAVSSSGVDVTGLSKSSLPTGSVLQVVNATYGVEVFNATSTYADTGLTATITPTSATSKILVLVTQAGCFKVTGNTYLGLQLLRGASVIQHIERLGGYTNNTTSNDFGSCSSSYLDSPATTSATTYKTQFSSIANLASVGVQASTASIISVSTITLMEIAA